MKNLSGALNEYKANLLTIQKAGRAALNNKRPNATIAFKAARSMLAENSARIFLDIIMDESDYVARLGLISKLSDELSKIPAQVNSKATVLVTFDYQFLSSLSASIWGFPTSAKEIADQQKISSDIVFATCGKQKEETEKEKLLPDLDVLCMALQYLFIYQKNGIYDSSKHNNVKKLIDTHYQLDNDLLYTALTTLYTPLKIEDRQKFIALIQGVSGNFTNTGIIRVFAKFMKNNMITSDAYKITEVIQSMANVGENVSPTSSTGSSSSYIASPQKIDKYNHQYGPIARPVKKPNSTISASDEIMSSEVIQPMVDIDKNATPTLSAGSSASPQKIDKYNHPYGPIARPIKKLNFASAASDSEKNTSSQPEVQSKTIRSQQDLSKIIWGVPADEERDIQIKEFRAFIKTLKMSEQSVRLAIQFLVLIKGGDQSLLCNTYREKAIELISSGASDIDAALGNIYSALKSPQDKENFIRVLAMVARDFNGIKDVQIRKKITDFQLSHCQIERPTPSSKMPEESNPALKIRWGVQDESIRPEQIEHVRNCLLNIDNYDNEMKACLALQFIILHKYGLRERLIAIEWPLATKIIAQQTQDCLNAAIKNMYTTLQTTAEKINFIRALKLVENSFTASQFSYVYNSIASFCKKLQIAIHVCDKNIAILQKAGAVDMLVSKTGYALLVESNDLLGKQIINSVNSEPESFDAKKIYPTIARARCLIKSEQQKSEKENSKEQKLWVCDKWQQQTMLFENNANNNSYAQSYTFNN